MGVSHLQLNIQSCVVGDSVDLLYTTTSSRESISDLQYSSQLEERKILHEIFQEWIPNEILLACMSYIPK